VCTALQSAIVRQAGDGPVIHGMDVCTQWMNAERTHCMKHSQCRDLCKLADEQGGDTIQGSPALRAAHSIDRLPTGQAVRHRERSARQGTAFATDSPVASNSKQGLPTLTAYIRRNRCNRDSNARNLQASQRASGSAWLRYAD